MQTRNPNLRFRMDSKDDQFFQTAIWGTPPDERTHTQRFDLVIRSGRNGQTYLFWDDDFLNAFNTVNLAVPNTTVAQSTTGVINASQPARSIQFAPKLYY